MKKSMVIVLGPNSAYTLGLTRCIGEGYAEAGKTVDLTCVVFGCPGYYTMLSRWPRKVILVNSPEEGVEYILNNLRMNGARPILLGANDYTAAAIDDRLNELEPYFNCSRAGGQSGIVRLMDKRFQVELAERFGFKVPNMIRLKKGQPTPENLKYPVFTKSCRTIDGGKIDEFICETREELENARKRITAEEIFVADYINKKTEQNYYGLVIHKVVNVPLKDLRCRFPPQGYGGYQHVSTCTGDDLVERIKNMISATGYDNGLFDVEFLEGQDGELYFMEINFRHDGMMSRLLPGINLPYLLCRSFEGESLTPNDFISRKERFTAINEFIDFRYMVLGRRCTLFSWMKDFLAADGHLLFDCKDMRPVLGVFWRKLRILCSNILQKLTGGKADDR